MTTYWFYGKSDRWQDAYDVRRHVFIEEQGYSAGSEYEELDAHCWHVLALGEGGEVLGTARMYKDEKDPDAWHIGRVAVELPARGKGVGAVMLQSALDKLEELGASAAILGSQHDKTGFYARFGFAPTGDTYDDEGTLHVMMQKNLV